MHEWNEMKRNEMKKGRSNGKVTHTRTMALRTNSQYNKNEEWCTSRAPITTVTIRQRVAETHFSAFHHPSPSPESLAELYANIGLRDSISIRNRDQIHSHTLGAPFFCACYRLFFDITFLSLEHQQQ